MKNQLLIISILLLIGAGCQDKKQTEQKLQTSEVIKQEAITEKTTTEPSVPKEELQDKTPTPTISTKGRIDAKLPSLEKSKQKDISTSLPITPKTNPLTDPGLKQNIQTTCTYSCGEHCYSNNPCNENSTFNCGADNTVHCCAVGGMFCNNTCWNPTCPNGSTFTCSANGNGANCMPNAVAPLSNTVPKQNSISNVQTSELLKTFDNQLAEIKRQSEMALKQLYADQEQMKQEIAPLQLQIDDLDAKRKELECDVLTMDKIIGSIAQECQSLNSQIGLLVAQISGITGKYNAKLGIIPKLNFTTQQPVSGQYYKFFYDGNGSGSVYNVNNPTEGYKIYCTSGMCDIYSN